MFKCKGGYQSPFASLKSVIKDGKSVAFIAFSQCSFAEMFKKLISIFLLFALIGSNFSRYVAVVSFEINKRYIAKNLCENRTRPQLHCNGKCYLMKKLKQADESEKKQAEKNELKNFEICLLQQPFQLSFAAPYVDGEPLTLSSFYTFIYVSHPINSIFRPPQIVA